MHVRQLIEMFNMPSSVDYMSMQRLHSCSGIMSFSYD